MPRKRRETLAPEVPKRPKLVSGERSDVTRCHCVTEALQSLCHLPEECKALLLEATPLTLGVPVKERDKRQVAVAGFIGEEMETKLLQDVIDSKMSSQEEVISAQLTALSAASQVQDARRRMEEMEEQLALRLSEDDAACSTLGALRARIAILEAAQAKAEEGRRQARQEHELCIAACGRLQPDDDSGAPSTPLDHKALAALCTKLELEEPRHRDSLLSTLPLILQKSHASRSYLERAASKLICEALQKHLSQLDSTSGPAVSAPPELLELRTEMAEAEKLQQEKLGAVQEARKQLQDFQSALAKAQAAETSALAKLEDVKHLGETSPERQLLRLRKGALQAYQSLDGTWPANLADQVMQLEEKVQQLDQTIQQEAQRRFATPAPKRRRLRPLVELPLEATMA
eukprot:s1636_g2.t1